MHSFSPEQWGRSVDRTLIEAETAIETKPGPAMEYEEPVLQTILLVEDEDFVRDVACQVLLFAGYNVLAARNAAEAKQIFAERGDKVALLLSDVMLPGRNGSELARELQAAQPRLKTILISGYPQSRLHQHHSPESDALYLAKPFSADTLMGKVRQVLEASQAPARETGGGSSPKGDC